ncbi:prepilin peptidase [Paenibacillus sp. GCM10027627]|uniref:A24 family peptidase n=1 Tax=unclassified Paenibacillus TaxID=185978 RepID=UPI00364135EA
MSFVFAVTAVGLVIALITDLRNQTIPNWLTVIWFSGAVIYHFVQTGWHGLLFALGGASAGFFPLLLLYALKGIGAGDVKLFGAVGAWMGVATVVQLMLYSILYAGVIGIVVLAVSRSFAQKMSLALWNAIIPDGFGFRSKGNWFDWAKSGKSFPFMLAVAPAAASLWMVAYS